MSSLNPGSADIYAQPPHVASRSELDGLQKETLLVRTVLTNIAVLDTNDNVQIHIIVSEKQTRRWN